MNDCSEHEWIWIFTTHIEKKISYFFRDYFQNKTIYIVLVLVNSYILSRWAKKMIYSTYGIEIIK